LTVSDHIGDRPRLSLVVGKWILIAGSIGFVLQLVWCLHENLFDEAYFTRRYIIQQTIQLTEAVRFRDGRLEVVSERALALYRGEHAAAYGYRIVDAQARVLSAINGDLVESLSPLKSAPRLWPDAWQHKIGGEWFNVIGGVKHRAGDRELWVEVMTLGDPQLGRLAVLAQEIYLDVLMPLGPTLLLTTLLAVLAVSRALRPLVAAADRARALDARSVPVSFDVSGLPREAASFVTAINRLMARVESLVREQKQFVARAAHELRTRLAIFLLELNKIPDNRARRLEKDVAQMSDTVYRLLTMARLEASSDAAEEPQLVELRTIADGVVAQIAPLAELRCCWITVKNDRPIPFRGNPNAVQEAVWNVVENAIKHGPDGNRVQITCGPGSAVTIDDGGPGLIIDDVERLYQPFERGRSSADGAGLGLTIARVGSTFTAVRLRPDVRRSAARASSCGFPHCRPATVCQMARSRGFLRGHNDERFWIALSSRGNFET
jgi:signal transduction histidine kinase